MPNNFGQDRLATIKSFSSSFEANLIAARLRDAGFECTVGNEYTTNNLPNMDIAYGGARLLVFESDVDEVGRLISEWEGGTPDHPACPNCNSVDTLIMKDDNETMLKRLGFLLVGIISSAPPRVKSKFHCNNCGEEFTF